MLIDGQAITYQFDVCDPTRPWERDKTVHLVAMRNQVEQLRSAIEGEPVFASLEQVFFRRCSMSSTLRIPLASIERKLNADCSGSIELTSRSLMRWWPRSTAQTGDVRRLSPN